MLLCPDYSTLKAPAAAAADDDDGVVGGPSLSHWGISGLDGYSFIKKEYIHMRREIKQTRRFKCALKAGKQDGW